MFVLIFSILTLLVFVMTKKEGNNISSTNSNTYEITAIGPAKEDIPTTGNDSVYLTSVGTKIRVINEYDENIFTAKKNLLIMLFWIHN